MFGNDLMVRAMQRIYLFGLVSFKKKRVSQVLPKRKN